MVRSFLPQYMCAREHVLIIVLFIGMKKSTRFDVKHNTFFRHIACIRPSTTAARSSPGSLSLCGIFRSRVLHTGRLVVRTFCTEMKYVYVARTCHHVALCKQHIPVSTCHNARGSVAQTAAMECHRQCWVCQA